MQDFYLVTKQMCVGYHDIPVVKDVEFALHKGEILTLIGPNGSGKTTVLRSLINQLKLIAGVATIDKEDISNMDATKLAKAMGIVLTKRLETEMMTVQDVVETGRYPYTGRLGILSKEDYNKVDEAMKLVKVEALKDMDFAKLSDGQRQRVMLARALAQEPEIIVLDEPTSFLDIKYKMEFLSVLRKLAKERKLTVVMSLHEVEMAMAVSDQIACLKNGIVEKIGTRDEIVADNYLLKLFDVNMDELTEEFGSVARKYMEG